MSERHALMWSGGKDSALALDRAIRSGIVVDRLLSFYDSATRRVRFHSTRVEMLEAQAAAIGIEAPQLLLKDFVSAGGRAVITGVELAKLDESWLGRVIDDRFASEIARTGVDTCGENGEYHSFAFAGPVFKKPLPWTAGERCLDSGFAQLDITEGA